MDRESGGSARVLIARFGPRCEPALLRDARYFVICGRLRLEIEPRDLVQQTYVHAFEIEETFSGTTPEHLLQWLRNILRNDALNLIRQKKRTMAKTNPDYAAHPEAMELIAIDGVDAIERLEWEERRRRLHEAISCLGDLERRLIQLVFFEGFSPRAAGRALGLDERVGVYRVLKRALQTLRKLLEIPAPLDGY